MTDRRTSPLANKADVVVTAQVDGLGFTNSYVAPLSLSGHSPVCEVAGGM